MTKLTPASNYAGRSKRFPYWIPEVPRRIRLLVRGLYYRARYGVAPQDVWSFDSYLGVILANGLQQLAETTWSYPNGKTFEDWQKELLWAAEGFKRLNEEKWDAIGEQEKELHKLKDELFDWVKANYFGLWD